MVCIGIAGFIFRNEIKDTQTLSSPEIKIEAPTKIIKAVSVLVQKSTEREVTNGILLRGQTSAFKSVQVKAKTSGSVISQPIRKGTFVEKGELLCELEVGTKTAALAEAKAKLAEADTNNKASANLVKKVLQRKLKQLGVRLP